MPKVRYIWLTSDIVGGLRVQPPCRSETWMVAIKGGTDKNRYFLVSLKDGFAPDACCGVTADEMARRLTDGEKVPDESRV